jgi:transcriptional regulator with XRE-family HTH domain
VADKIDKRTKPLLVGLGRHLRRVREALGIPQVVLAQKIGIEPPNLSRIEHGEKNLTIDTLRRIAEGLGVELVVKVVRKRR